MTENAEPIRPRKRRITITDLVVMVAVVAVSFKGFEWILSGYGDTSVESILSVIRQIRKQGIFGEPFFIQYWFELAASFLVAAVVALYVLRFVPPRPDRADRDRMPGARAMSAAALSSLFIVGNHVVFIGLLRVFKKFVTSGMSETIINNLVRRVPNLILLSAAAAVFSAWVSLLGDRRPKPETDWIEWSGRVMGVILILCAPFYLWSALIR